MSEGGGDTPAGAPEGSKDSSAFADYLATADLDAKDSWSEEPKRVEYVKIHEAAQDLYRAIRTRKGDPKVQSEPLNQMTYRAAHYLILAMLFVLEDPTHVANVTKTPGKEPEPPSDEEKYRAGIQEDFLHKIALAFKELNLPDDALKGVLPDDFKGFGGDKDSGPGSGTPSADTSIK